MWILRTLTISVPAESYYFKFNKSDFAKYSSVIKKHTHKWVSWSVFFSTSRLSRRSQAKCFVSPLSCEFLHKRKKLIKSNHGTKDLRDKHPFLRCIDILDNSLSLLVWKYGRKCSRERGGKASYFRVDSDLSETHLKTLSKVIRT